MTTENDIRGTETHMGSVRERFGGVDTPAALLGMFTALGVLVLLGALIAAGGGALEYQLNVFDIEGNAQEVTIVGMIVAILVVLASFFVGGIGAGRMARYDGGVNGLASATWALLLVAIFAALGVFLGAEYNAFQQAGLPDWFSQLRVTSEEATMMGVVAAVLSIAAMFLGAYLGGKLGETYHRRVDAALSDRRTEGSRRAAAPEEERI